MSSSVERCRGCFSNLRLLHHVHHSAGVPWKFTIVAVLWVHVSMGEWKHLFYTGFIHLDKRAVYWPRVITHSKPANVIVWIVLHVANIHKKCYKIKGRLTLCIRARDPYAAAQSGEVSGGGVPLFRGILWELFDLYCSVGTFISYFFFIFLTFIKSTLCLSIDSNLSRWHILW